ncbi:hypothetical protein ACX93W_15275 [Paenibacillus sp. CAU 1782]
MKALLAYLHKSFMTSYRYAPPMFVYLLGIIFVYSVVPNPVMGSYAFSASFLFVVSIALGAAVIDLEKANQELITTMHAGGLSKLNVAKVLYSWCFLLPLGCFAVAYPALLNKFDRAPTIEELLMATGYHAAAAWLGISIACWFTVKLFASRVQSLMLLAAVIACSLGAKGLENVLPQGWSAVLHVLPPIRHSIYAMINYDSVSWAVKLWAMIGCLLYGLVSALLFTVLMNKRKLN